MALTVVFTGCFTVTNKEDLRKISSTWIWTGGKEKHASASSPSIMCREMFVLSLWFVCIQEGAAIRPVVTFNPNYKKIFTTERMTMTCDVGSTIGEGMDYIWYKDNSPVHNGKSYTIQDARTSDSGNYQCQTRPGEISDPVTLGVSDGYVILQTPLYVYEGDNINIRCHHYPRYSAGQTIFYKDNEVLIDWGDDAEYNIINVTRTTAGTYRCGKVVSYQYEDETSVSVEELFQTPTISVTPHPVFRNDNVTLRCETRLPPPRQKTRLHFTFYREGRMVQGFGVSDIYEVYNVQLEDSGNYSCEVETTDKRVRKKSAERLIQIQELFSHPNITVTHDVYEGDPMTLTCDTTLSQDINHKDVQFSFYRDGRMVQGFNSSNKYEVHSAQLEDPGNYTCEVKSSKNPTRKRSNEYNISVKELFSPPILRSSREGDNVMMSCDTVLTKQRPRTQLQYSFYRDGQNVQRFNSSNKYEVQFIEMENSTFTCEIQTSDSRVRKRSQDLRLPGSMFLYIIVSVGSGLLLLIIIIISIVSYKCHQRKSSANNPQPTPAFDMTHRKKNHLPKDKKPENDCKVENSKAKRKVRVSQDSPSSNNIYENLNS
ncbi:hypothetical protein GDO81_014818 [Engystomops pustulosus]|uniref:Ig-like domain-containing protein n=2 Tax=Engystomops pustulosus TaxID=76066 RepID=A0AAV7AQ03_ENGPU|nr:hypothetical protein GDO81_014818 [Engystomops pustulosus]